jgi:hypothetical protein
MLLFTAGYVLGILGVARCNNAPPDSGAHGTAVMATVMLLVSGVLALFVFFLIILILFDARVEVPPWLAGWSFMLQPGTLVAAWALFLVFLMQGTRAVKAPGVAAGTLGLLVVFMVIANLALMVNGPLGFMRVFLTLMMGRMAGGGGRPPRGGGMEDPSAGGEGELGKVVTILLPTIVLAWFVLQLILAGVAIRSRRGRGVA